jgi:plastocyanin
MRFSRQSRVALIAVLLPAAGISLPEFLSPSPAAVTHLVRMNANSFAPAVTRARAGDTVRFVNGQGGPHNVEFIADSIGAAARGLLERAMPGGRDKLGPLSGPLLLDEDEAYSVIVPSMAEGRYAFLCLPHQAFMRGTLVVVR